ncbi:MAG: ABC transporter permease [Acidimicrobiia bacterium]
MREAFDLEMLKLRRSPVTWVTSLLILILCPGLCIGFVSVVEGSGNGPLAAKVQALVTGTGWTAYLGLLDQFVASAFFVGVGVVIIWCFGREFSDRTVGSLFGLPVSRPAIAAAKFIALLAWSVGLSVALVAVAIGLGVVGGLGSPDGAAWAGLAKLLVVAILTALIALTVAFPASLGRGYLPGIGALVVMLMTAQLAVLFESGAWYPFAAPGLWAVSGQQDVVVGLAQLAMVPVTAGLVGVATIRWWSGFEVV